MKINNNNNNYNNMLKSLKKTNETLSANKADNKIDQKQEVSSKKSVEISFSKEAQELAELSKNSAHTERVEEIKNAIANGSYAIEPEAIVKGILDTIKGQKGVE